MAHICLGLPNVGYPNITHTSHLRAAAVRDETSPEGTKELSPALQGWVNVPNKSRVP